MKLSMWILADWLKEYEPTVKIEAGDMTVQSARSLSFASALGEKNVYVAPLREYSDEKSDRIICVNAKDMLVLNCENQDEILNQIFDAFDYYGEWYDRMVEIVRENSGTLQQLIDLSDEIFGNPVVIYNVDHLVAACSRGYEEKLADIDPEWKLVSSTHSNSMEMYRLLNEHIQRSKHTKGIHHLDFSFVHTTALERILFRNGKVAGRVLVMEYFHKMTPGQEQMMEAFCRLIEQWLAFHQEDPKMLEECEDLIRLLHRETVSPEKITHKLSLNGWDPEHPKLLYKIELNEECREITYPLFIRISHLLEKSYLFQDEQHIYILANTAITEESEIRKQLLFLQTTTEFLCGISYPFTDITRLWNASEQCDIAMAYAQDNKKGLYYCKNYALKYLKSALRAPSYAPSVHPSLALLRDNDAVYHGELYQTLFTFLTNNCNVTHTARELNLHRNSLLYRLNRIRELTELSFDDPETREYLYLSYVQEGLL